MAGRNGRDPLVILMINSPSGIVPKTGLHHRSTGAPKRITLNFARNHREKWPQKPFPGDAKFGVIFLFYRV
ncbi:hypothetical protein CRP01_20070 [Flavilitoribacter nigricans DSM 23189 = NBRC 102662]|uniref:Uncharacterized protein n=1 Tax=Flavilitoribacter nigricans (strain ATCC 23147 / DSM 23189 / NBRC 102662 / NCIMB 1420 / SS-2) TaxID=1122177 RepID=A0A2D0N9I9_FLAN2|nr:hypothetical protein CRP01_20070 [Flavilitoribacter nigricans DSM 23189 = NBRC 102662]